MEIFTAKIDSALLRESELFGNFSQNEIDFVISRSGALRLSPGELLFSPEEKADHFYILIRGVIRIFKQHDSGEDEIARFTTGDVIGDFDFARGGEYDAWARAVEVSELIMFPGSGFTMNSLVTEDPGTVCRILLNAVVMITERIKSTRRLILDNMSWVQELHRRAYEDSGTGLWKQSLIADEIAGVLKDPAALIMLKPDRFKILVDSRGHDAGDEAMVKIALILKNITRRIGHGWPMRFKSNEVGIILNACGASGAEEIAGELSAAIAALEPVPAQGGIPPFHFSATVSWAVWPQDNAEWDDLFQGNYALLMDTWRAGGDRVIHYRKEQRQ
ncbi:MAG: diguanylate cyclase [Treponema sp.]|jgi:diguanylate cyclase (GGDEF)-like protein|nr:diguanylate cyclase [Treponema sp.]